MKVIFAGTPEFSIDCFNALIKSQHKVLAVLTQPDRPSGRGQKVTESPIKKLALEYNFPLYQPQTLKSSDIQNRLRSLNADIMIDVAFGLLVPKEILNMFPLGCINVHPSLLPRWRGASPIQYTILSGDKETGVSIIKLDEGLDTGPILLQEKYEVYENETAGDLQKRLSKFSADLLIKTLEKLEVNEIIPKEQDDNFACYASKIKKEDAKIDWKKSAVQIHREILAFNPVPVSHAEIGDQIIRIWQAIPLDELSKEPFGKIIRLDKKGIDVVTGEGILRIQNLQFPGGKPLDVHDILKSKKEFFVKNSFFT